MLGCEPQTTHSHLDTGIKPDNPKAQIASSRLVSLHTWLVMKPFKVSGMCMLL